MSDMKCPYCGADQEVCHDDGHGYTEGVKHEHTCTECERPFVFETFIAIYYEAHKADCLSDAPHIYKPTSTFPRVYTRMECTACGHERNLTAEEMADVIAQDAALSATAVEG